MTDLSSVAIVPPVPLPRRTGAAQPDPSARALRRPPLPLLQWSDKRVGAAVYGLSRLDAGGRIADRASLAALGWAPGQRLDIRASGGLITVVADDGGVFRVSTQQFLHSPVAARRRCELTAGDRVLLAAYPQGGLLVVHPPALLDTVVDRMHAQSVKVGGDE